MEKIGDSVAFVRDRPKPLAIYVFTNDEALKRRVVAETSSGSVVFNDTMIQVSLLLLHRSNNKSRQDHRQHSLSLSRCVLELMWFWGWWRRRWPEKFAVDTLPFGGVGGSGFGRYHGKFSFDAFSHEKAVMRRQLLLDFPFRYPPWNETKLRFLRDVYHFDYLGLLLLIMGLKK